MKVDIIKYIENNDDITIKEMVMLAEDILDKAFEYDEAEADELFDADNYAIDQKLMPQHIIDMIKEDRIVEVKHELESLGV